MRQPKAIVNGYSWVGIVNILFFQWFFTRLNVTCKDDRVIKIGFIGPVVPLTGWWSPYIWWPWRRNLKQ